MPSLPGTTRLISVRLVVLVFGAAAIALALTITRAQLRAITPDTPCGVLQEQGHRAGDPAPPCARHRGCSAGPLA